MGRIVKSQFQNALQGDFGPPAICLVRIGGTSLGNRHLWKQSLYCLRHHCGDQRWCKGYGVRKLPWYVSVHQTVSFISRLRLSSILFLDDYPHEYYEYTQIHEEGMLLADIWLSFSEPSEHIQLWCSGSGPWYEVSQSMLVSSNCVEFELRTQFPIMPDGSIYTSTPSHYRSPGTDRVVFTESGTYCA